MQSQGPSQFPSRLPPHLVTSSPRLGDQATQWLVSLGTLASAGRHLAPPQCLLQSTPEPGVWVRRTGGGGAGPWRQEAPTEAGQCCCAGFSGRCHRPGAEPSAGWTWPRSF